MNANLISRICCAFVLQFLAIIPALASNDGEIGLPFPGRPLACLSETNIDVIRSQPSEALPRVYADCRPEISLRLSSFDLDDTGLKAAFGAIAAHAMAPYGQSTVLGLQALLAERGLDCDNYAALTAHFIRILLPNVHGAVSIIGMDGGAVGNHAQVMLKVSNTRSILADPTIGLIADEDFDGLFRGNPLDDKKLASFYAHHDADILKFGAKVYAAVHEGSYRPSDLLYYFDGLDAFIRFSKKVGSLFIQHPVPTGAVIDSLPTPAANDLRHTLDAMNAAATKVMTPIIPRSP